MRTLFYLFLIVYTAILLVVPAQAQQVKVNIISDEAHAVLDILAKRNSNQTISESDWQKLFQSEGFLRLKKRELSFKIPFTDENFKNFVLSEDLLKRYESLKNTLAVWEKANPQSAAKSALKYLPNDATIRAKIYPVIKPRDNSFVFEIKENPAIFLFLDPAVTKEKFENTLAHELHHIGYGTVCPKSDYETEIKKLSEEKQIALKWISAFGEGFAMLAAAGDPDTHPHKFSDSADRQRWDNDVKNFNQDLRTVEKFFLDVITQKLTGDNINETAFSFYGIQGLWYTVGWKMSVVIEKTFGRKKLIEVFCDKRKLFSTYNLAVSNYNKKHKENLGIWSNQLIDQLK